jgi:hypothetical protein
MSVRFSVSASAQSTLARTVFVPSSDFVEPVQNRPRTRWRCPSNEEEREAGIDDVHVVARAAFEIVLAARAEEEVIALPAEELVLIPTADQRVAAAVAFQHVAEARFDEDLEADRFDVVRADPALEIAPERAVPEPLVGAGGEGAGKVEEGHRTEPGDEVVVLAVEQGRHEDVRRAVARQHVGFRVTGAVDLGFACQHQVLNELGKRQRHTAFDPVVPPRDGPAREEPEVLLDHLV